mgnify:CR=1 FL=1
MRKRGVRWTGLIVGILAAAAVGWLGLQQVRKEELSESVRKNLGGTYVELAEGSVHYRLSGPKEGELVILIHGFSVPGYVWEATVPALTAEGYQVLHYDLWGRGRSDRPDLTYDLELFTDQLEQLRQTLELTGTAHLIGLSMGGPIAARYAADHPERVATVTLIAPEAGQTTNRTIFPLNLPVIGELVMAGYLEPVLLPSIQEDDFYAPARFPDWEERYREQIQFRGFGRALLSTIRHLPEIDPGRVYHLMSTRGIPVLLVWGQEDQTFSRKDMTGVEQALGEVDFQAVPAAGHLPHLERPELVNPLIVEFLRAH